MRDRETNLLVGEIAQVRLRAGVAQTTAEDAGNVAQEALDTANDAVPAVNYTADDVLAKLLTVDGDGSGLDADALDGQPGSYYAARANHTGSQVAATISDLPEAVQDLVGAMLTQGANVTLTYDDATGALTIALSTSPALTGTPTAPTAASATSNTQIATTAFVHACITDLINASPSTLDTLKELADAIGDDPNFATTVATSIATKLAKASNLSDLTNPATARTNLGVAINSDVQAFSANLAAMAGVVSAADKLFYFTGSGAGSVTPFTAAGRALMDDATAADQRTTLGLGTAAVKNTGTSGDAVPILNGGATTWDAGATFGGDVKATGAITAAGTWAGAGSGHQVWCDVDSGVGRFGSYDLGAGAYKPMLLAASKYSLFLSSLGNYANDAAAAAGGVAVEQLYRNGSVVMIRSA